VTDGATAEQGRGAQRISHRTSAWLAWSLAALCVGLFLSSVIVFVLARSARDVPSSLATRLTLIDLLVGVPVLVFPIVGVLIASKRPRNPIGWIFLANGLLFVLYGLINYLSMYGLARPGSVPFPVGLAALTQWLWVPTVGLLPIFMVLLFPDGRLPSKSWRPLAWLSGIVIVSESIAEGLAPGPLSDMQALTNEVVGEVRNPFGIEGQTWLTNAANGLLVLLLVCILMSASSLVLRFRRSSGETRQQIKWITFAASVIGLVFVSLMVISLIELYFAPEGWGSADTAPPGVELLFYTMLLSFAGVPVAVGFAVLKYRLYDIDVIINRALVYGPLTVSLALVYFGGIVVLQWVFVILTGQKSTLAVVASTLLIAALFTPLRHRIQSFIDRRFYRRKYDARKTLEAFSSKLRDETDLDALNNELVGVVRETMQPARVSLWLRPVAEVGQSREPSG
jgi:ABC-type multidrug transport system fused ATPase/permease subunit